MYNKIDQSRTWYEGRNNMALSTWLVVDARSRPNEERGREERETGIPRAGGTRVSAIPNLGSRVSSRECELCELRVWRARRHSQSRIAHRQAEQSESGAADDNDGRHQRWTECYGTWEKEFGAERARGSAEVALSDGERGGDAAAALLEYEGQVQLHRPVAK